MRKPVRVMPQQTNRLRRRLEELYVSVPDGWQIFVTNTNRGRCCPDNKNLTVPLWAFNAGPRGLQKHNGNHDYMVYYACHELAHIATSRFHDAAFMKEFKRICPARLWHFELNYKPRNAAAAGITG